MERHDSVCRSQESELLDSVQNNDTNKIRSIVKENPGLLSKIYGHPDNKPILYIACSRFAKDVQPRTIDTLIDLGADLYYADKGDNFQEALHFATLGGNPDILQRIIERLEPGKINSVTYHGNTALNLLIRNWDVSAINLEKCLKHLLNAPGIDVNRANLKDHTPLLWAAYKKYRNVIDIILNHKEISYIDIDTHTIKDKSARMLIQEHKLYEGALPEPYSTNNNETDAESLIACIKKSEEDAFLLFPNIDDYVDHEVEEGTLLQLACKRNLKKIVNRLIEHNANVAKTTGKNVDFPIEIAANEGYHEIFEALLKKCTKLPTTLLTNLLRKVDYSTTPNVDYQKCIKILLNERSDVLVNTRCESGNTPLHYSARYADVETTLNLLSRGASLGNKNSFGYLPVEDIDPVTLEKHFNSCVTAEPKDKCDKQSTVLTFDYKTLIPTKTEERVQVSKNQTDVEASCCLLTNDVQDGVLESDVVYAMAKIPELRPLLIHPLITGFLYMKWHRIRRLFIANILMYALFCLSLISHIFLTYNSILLANYPSISYSISALLVITFILLLVREILQIIISPKMYFFQLENWLEIALITVTAFIIFQNSPEPITVRQLSSIAILLAALEMMLLVGQHPQLSTYIVMLRTVSWNFFKFLLWYAILILAFALSFYTLFNKNGDNSSENKNCTSSETAKDDDAEQDFFVDPSLTIIKTIVMLTGEFDASSINFEPLPNRIIFIVFVFMITIILFNLLNGLAVSDTQMIKNNAEVVAHIERINRIVYIERMVLGNILPMNLFLFINKFCCCLPIPRLKKFTAPTSFVNFVSLFQNFLKGHKLEVYLNRDGKVILHNQECCGINCGGIYLDSKTIKRSRKLLQMRKLAECEAAEYEATENHKLVEAEKLNQNLQSLINSQREVIHYLELKISEMEHKYSIS